jgi:hypothetical protein
VPRALVGGEVLTSCKSAGTPHRRGESCEVLRAGLCLSRVSLGEFGPLCPVCDRLLEYYAPAELVDDGLCPWERP